MINKNVTLAADGQPLIGSSNTTSQTGLGVAALSEAADKLRVMAGATGNRMNLRPATWVVAGGEVTARATLAFQQGIQVVCNPWLSAGASYLLCDPAQQPVFSRLRLSQLPLRPDVMQSNPRQEYDGVILTVEIAVGICAVSRLGIVKIPTS